MIKIAVVTPVYNGSSLIKETFDSILDQRNFSDFSLTYIVRDGSPNNDIEVLVERHYRQLFESKKINFFYVLEPDHGMYDALVKGFSLCGDQHDVFAYINAGDYYSPYAFSLVSQLFSSGSIDWLTGSNARYTETGYLCICDLPVLYPKDLISKGVFGKLLPAIQQESTFWSQQLHKKLDLDQLSKCKYAGDFYIWKTFSHYSDLDIVCAWLSGFRIHSGQLSQLNVKSYMEELKQIAKRLGLFDLIYAALLRVAWHLPLKLKLLANKNIIRV